VGVSGGIAAYKTADIVSKLVQKGADVFVIMTKNATQFVNPLTFQALTGNRTTVDQFDPQLLTAPAHIKLSEEANLMLIAPATANIIGKIACGIADDALTTTVLSVNCPILIAPAMNQRMFKNKVVQENLKKLTKRGIKVIHPEEGYLACGEIGVGRLAGVEKILSAVKKWVK
jgi:phosphopantothenoylcysteine decarboxylase/phosphopantothenate--cysteine ligase